MSLSKRVVLAVLCLIVVAVAASSAAAAPNPKRGTGTARLRPPASSDEPRASGVAHLDVTWYTYRPPPAASGTLSVSCRWLTPGATYSVRVDTQRCATGTADDRGGLLVAGNWGSYMWPSSVAVYRVEETGPVLVLSGDIAWAYP